MNVSGYPDLARYEALYATYLGGRSDGAMMAGMGDLQGARVLELCAGGCRMSKMALAAGASAAVAVDACAKMFPHPLPEGVDARVSTVADFLDREVRAKGKFDAVVCRQGVNYWFGKGEADLLGRVVRPGGSLVFNTFNQRPSEEPRIVKREAGGVVFTEISWLDGETVRHVQAAPGMEPHMTSFRWIGRDEYSGLLVAAGFEVREEVSGPASVWVCERGA